MKLLIIRHAESQGNATGDYSIDTADSLSDRGWEQAAALADDLSSHSFDQIIVSPLQRAIETITPYLQATNQQAELWPELAEACWHDQREPAADAWRPQPATLPEELTNRFVYRDGRAVQHTQPETFGQGLRRVHDAKQQLESLPAHLSVLMVTHGHFIRELLNLMFDTTDHAGHIDNCGKTSLTYHHTWQLTSADH